MTLTEDGDYSSSPSVHRGELAIKREQTGCLLIVCRARASSRPFRAQYDEAGREFLITTSKNSSIGYAVTSFIN